MYPSLSIIDDAEIRRRDLLADAAAKHDREAHRQARRASVMATLVTASYGIAMGQRPVVAGDPDRERTSRIDGRSCERPLRNDLVVAARVRHTARALAAAIANAVRPQSSRASPR